MRHAQVSAGLRHSVVLSDQGQVFSWGFNKFGQLGTGSDTEAALLPKVMVGLPGCVKDIRAAYWHTLLLC